MFNFIRKRMNKKGFTLVELLIVIAVLGIIAGIAIPRMSGVTDSFKIRADEETGRNLARQVQIRVQAGILPVPADATYVVVPLNDDADLSLGEDFTKTPQYNSMYADADKTRAFLIMINNTDIKVYNVKSGVSVAPATTADGRTLHTLVHGGKIQ